MLDRFNGSTRLRADPSMEYVASFPARSGPDVSCIPIWDNNGFALAGRR
jgi:hypothetical protein